MDSRVSLAACLVTNRIMNDGAPSKFAPRDPHRLGPQDSSWRFFAGDDDDDYMDEVSNRGVYSINTVANFDPVIITILDEAPGTAWVRVDDALIPTLKASRRRVPDSQNVDPYYPYLFGHWRPRLHERTYLPVEVLPMTLDDSLVVGWVWWNDADNAARCEPVPLDGAGEHKRFGGQRWSGSIARRVIGGMAPSAAIADI